MYLLLTLPFLVFREVEADSSTDCFLGGVLEVELVFVLRFGWRADRMWPIFWSLDEVAEFSDVVDVLLLFGGKSEGVSRSSSQGFGLSDTSGEVEDVDSVMLGCRLARVLTLLSRISAPETSTGGT